MSDAFRIEVEQWLRGAAGDEQARQTLAAIRIQVGDLCITRVEDLEAKTVRHSAHLSAYRLAYWLAEHWWRLRWEPEVSGEPADWLMRHSMAAAGDGFIWPPLLLASDGESLRLTLRADRDHLPMGPIRYLNGPDTLVAAADFERGVDDFLASVLSRLTSLGLGGSELELLWTEIAEERRNPELGRTRRLEALLGIDAGEAEEALLAGVVRYGRAFGASAVEEIAAAARTALPAVAAAAEARGPRVNTRAEVADRVILVDHLARLRAAAPPAWQLGEDLAHHARRLWHLGDQPLTNARLADIAGAPQSFLNSGQGEDIGTGMDGIGYREAPGATGFRPIIRSPFATNRRFQFARLVADDILAGSGDRLLPVTRAKTARQKLQRAFAAELLCPRQALQGMLPSEPDDEDLETAARHFDVSPLLVRTSLVNKGMLPRERLS